MYIHTEKVHNTRAAEQIVPFLMQAFNPSSIIDVGCGTGTWLKVFSQQNKVSVLQGVDGDYIDMNKLVMPAEWLLKHDLTKPLSLNRKFDLVISFEVAEHLPESAADIFVDTLTQHGDLIVFSAAIPGQTGQNHLNEQWQSYWADKFAMRGYKAYDIIRPLFWNNESVDVWYRQNMIVYSKHDLPFPVATTFNVIHPILWDMKNDKIASLETQLRRIREGKVGLFFPIKTFFRSLFRFGVKSK